MSVGHQLLLLLWKNRKLKLRSKKILLAEIAIPLLCAFILIWMRSKTSTMKDSKKKGPQLPHVQERPTNLASYKWKWGTHGMVGYAPDTAAIQYVMGAVRQGLLDKRRNYFGDPAPTTMGFGTPAEALEYAKSEPNMTAILVFEGEKQAIQGNRVPKRLNFTIRPLLEAGKSLSTDKAFPSAAIQCGTVSSVDVLQHVVVEAIARSWTQQKNQPAMRLDAHTQCMPYFEYTQDYTGQLIGKMLSGFIVASFFTSVVMFTKTIVAEKETKLKETMLLMGLEKSAYWLSWFLTFQAYFVPMMCAYTIALCTKHSDGDTPAVLKGADASLCVVFMLIYGVALVTFCFFVSALVHKGNMAAIVAGILYLGMYVLYFQGDGSRAVNILLALSFNVAMAHGFNAFSSSSLPGGEENNWGNFYKVPAPLEGGLSVLECMLLLLFDSVLHVMLAWYLEQVSPGEHGVARPYCLCLEGTRFYQVDASEFAKDDPSMDPRLFEPPQTDKPAGIKMLSLRRVFGTKVSVQGTTLDMYEDQITVLLGHNGAGKTVTMGMLTGFIAPTSGTAIINGYDIRNNLRQARGTIGLCPQLNVLFDWLTVREHLEFFSEMKGYTGEQRATDVSTYAEELELQYKMDTYSCQLAGGIKRKLSVGIALVGGSKVVILDEPTAGMDPSNRRETWGVLKRARTGRTMLLTTHYMDEADLLGDRIAIMADGKVQCCGSSMFLKKIYGSGYRLVVSLLEGCDLTALLNLAQKYVKTASLEKVIRAEAFIVLPETGVQRFPELFNALEQDQQELKISGFGICTTSMEEVFLKSNEEVPETKEGLASDEDIPQIVSEGRDSTFRRSTTVDSGTDEKTAAKPSHSSTFKTRASEATRLTRSSISASLIATADRTIKKKQSRTSATSRQSTPNEKVGSLAVPMPSGSKLLTTRESDEVEEPQEPRYYYQSQDLEEQEALPTNDGVKRFLATIWALMVKKTIYTWRKPLQVLVQLSLPAIIFFFAMVLTNDLAADEFAVPAQDKSLAYNLDGFKAARVPYHLRGGSKEGKQFESLYIKQFDGLANVKVEKITGNLTKDDVFNSYVLSKTQELSSPTVYREMPIGMEFLTADNSSVSGIAHFHAFPIHSQEISVNYLLNTMAQFVLKDDSYSIQSSVHPFYNATSSKEEEERKNPTIFFLLLKLGLVLGAFISFGFAFMGNVMVHFLIYERECGAKQMQVVSGAGPVVYWLSTFLFDYLLYALGAVFILVAAFAAFSMPLTSNWPAMLLALAMYGWVSLTFLYAAQFLFVSPYSGAIFTVVFNMLSGLITTFIATFMRLMVDVSSAPLAVDFTTNLDHFCMAFFPVYNIVCCFQNIFRNFYSLDFCKDGCTETSLLCCKANCTMACVSYEESYLSWDHPGIANYILAMALQGLVFFVLVMLVDFHFFERLWYLATCGWCAGEHAVKEDFPDEDSDVARERAKIVGQSDQYYKDHGPGTDQLSLVNVYKCYGTHVAVDHLCVGIPKGECFGLLGQNGAGKTTTFKMLTGDVLLTAGNAYVLGHDVVKNLRRAQTQVGYCPQFDGLIWEMTGRETLTMYARIRGVPEHLIANGVEELMKSFLFNDQGNVLCGVYSGGTKRKLNTAVALIGGPPVLLLDEPSWGMDPRARRQLWDVLMHLRNQGHTMVLTSHSMEEAEALCTRIAVMLNGQMVCLGSAQHLKTKFSRGYTFIVQLLPQSDGSPAEATPVIEFVMSQVEGCELFDQHQGYLHFKAPEKAGQLADIFSLLENAKASMPIADYTVQQTTLEQVFLAFTRVQKPPTTDTTRSLMSWLIPCFKG